MADDGDACVSCGQVVSICDHALARLTDPTLVFQGKVIRELQDDLAAERQRSARLREVAADLARWLQIWADDHPKNTWCHSEAALAAWRALAADDARRDGPEG